MKAIQVISKHAFLHDIGKEFGVNVVFLDRRWWELRPRMQVTIPVTDLKDTLRVQGRVHQIYRLNGYRPDIHMRMSHVES